MGKVFEAIDDKLRAFIEKQPMFFVATAPLAEDGLVNLSPKGLNAFRVLDGKQVAYLDLGGSGIETVAHVKENGRITIMFCAFEGPPRIVRLYGTGTVHERTSEGFRELKPLFPDFPGIRSIISVYLKRIADSCGFGVPLMQFQGQRTQLTDFAQKLGPEKVVEKMAKANVMSLDGLPGLSPDSLTATE